MLYRILLGEGEPGKNISYRSVFETFIHVYVRDS